VLISYLPVVGNDLAFLHYEAAKNWLDPTDVNLPVVLRKLRAMDISGNILAICANGPVLLFSLDTGLHLGNRYFPTVINGNSPVVIRFKPGTLELWLVHGTGVFSMDIGGVITPHHDREVVSSTVHTYTVPEVGPAKASLFWLKGGAMVLIGTGTSAVWEHGNLTVPPFSIITGLPAFPPVDMIRDSAPAMSCSGLYFFLHADYDDGDWQTGVTNMVRLRVYMISPVRALVRWDRRKDFVRFVKTTPEIEDAGPSAAAKRPRYEDGGGEGDDDAEDPDVSTMLRSLRAKNKAFSGMTTSFLGGREATRRRRSRSGPRPKPRSKSRSRSKPMPRAKSRSRSRARPARRR